MHIHADSDSDEDDDVNDHDSAEESDDGFLYELVDGDDAPDKIVATTKRPWYACISMKNQARDDKRDLSVAYEFHHSHAHLLTDSKPLGYITWEGRAVTHKTSCQQYSNATLYKMFLNSDEYRRHCDRGGGAVSLRLFLTPKCHCIRQPRRSDCAVEKFVQMAELLKGFKSIHLQQKMLVGNCMCNLHRDPSFLKTNFANNDTFCTFMCCPPVPFVGYAQDTCQRDATGDNVASTPIEPIAEFLEKAAAAQQAKMEHTTEKFLSPPSRSASKKFRLPSRNAEFTGDLVAAKRCCSSGHCPNCGVMKRFEGLGCEIIWSKHCTVEWWR